MRAAILQLNASDKPLENLSHILTMVRQASSDGAEFVFTPEVSNCLSTSRSHQNEVLCHQEDDQTLAALCNLARELYISISIGSLALKTGDTDGRFANRSFLINPLGEIVGQYDKIHMFDVQISKTETYRESAGYRPGEKAVVADTALGKVGMAICYDMRFPLLSNALAQAGAESLLYPAAFSPITGAAHWHSLLRARAIETGCYVIAAAQTGAHPTSGPKTRTTFGHSLVVDPWGEVILDAGTNTGVYAFDIEMDNVAKARQKVPSLLNARSFTAP
jgi:predicted amidohydrolase|tara:strand:- start:1084 stop:1914 length:831 start_codon:yes stop_codon:yes gene_type:complete